METFKSSHQNFQVSFGQNIQEKNICHLGPGTRLDIRLNENNIPKSGEEPINEIDRLAYIHDLAYQNSDDMGEAAALNERHRADQEMINGLKQLKNLSIPQRLIRTLIIKLFQAKILVGGQLIKSEKLGQGMPRKSKTEAINNLYSNEKTDIKTKHELNKMIRLANELHRPFRKPKQLKGIFTLAFCKM